VRNHDHGDQISHANVLVQTSDEPHKAGRANRRLFGNRPFSLKLHVFFLPMPHMSGPDAVMSSVAKFLSN
jgi:hypothetical protein